MSVKKGRQRNNALSEVPDDADADFCPSDRQDLAVQRTSATSDFFPFSASRNQNFLTQFVRTWRMHERGKRMMRLVSSGNLLRRQDSPTPRSYTHVVQSRTRARTSFSTRLS